MDKGIDLSGGSRRVWASWATAAACLAALFFTYAAYIPGLFSAWQREEYSHGILIPVVAMLLGLNILKEKNLSARPSLHGLWFIVAGYLFFSIAELSAFEPPAHYGFLLALSGILWTLYGTKIFIALIPALIYLVFAIPLPRLIEVSLTAELQLLSSSLGVFFLQIMGVSVFQDGNIIDLGTEKLQVVEACSGLRYLFPLMSFSFLLAFLFQAPLWKRAILFLSAIPITLLMNALRIAFVGILVNRWGSSMAEGLVHDMEGWTIFILCILVLLVEIWILSRIGKTKNTLRFDYINLPSRIDGLSGFRAGKAGLMALLVCLLGSGTLGALDLGNRTEIIPVRKNFFSFPLALEQWHGQQDFLPSNILEALKLTDYWNATYRRDNNEYPVNLYIAYYQSQRMGVAAHSPANCVPAGGWEVKDQAVVPVALETMTMPVTRMIIRKDNASMLVYYWFDQRGRVMNEQFSAKWYLLTDSITKKRTDGSVIRVMTQIDENSDEQSADERVEDFIRLFYPSIKTYIPQ